jgi:hypothetical protein
MFPRVVVCLKNISVDNLHKENTEDNNNSNNILVVVVVVVYLPGLGIFLFAIDKEY